MSQPQKSHNIRRSMEILLYGMYSPRDDFIYIYIAATQPSDFATNMGINKKYNLPTLGILKITLFLSL